MPLGRAKTARLPGFHWIAYPDTAQVDSTYAMPDQTRRPTHFFTVDVEEYFQVRALETAVDRSAWETLPRRLDRPMHILLDQLEAAGARGTFFTLGWVADRNPDIVRRIVQGGHELASHGYWHRRVADMTPAEFREDLR